MNRRSFLTQLLTCIVGVSIPGKLVAMLTPIRRGLTIEQITAVSYPMVLAEMRKTSNQWNESAMLRELERHGHIERVNITPIQSNLTWKDGSQATTTSDTRTS